MSCACTCAAGAWRASSISASPISPVPAGFQPLARLSPVIEMIGPVYVRRNGGGSGADLVLALRAEQKHCNMRGTVHGGILATLADITIGYSLAFSTEPPTAAVTTNLTLDFLSSAQIGDWLEASVEFQKLGSRVAFGNCYIRRQNGELGERVVRASAVFLVTGSLSREA